MADTANDLQIRHRELAYQTWRDNGHNLVATVRCLAKKHGYTISRQSLGKWRREYDWDGRAAREELEAKERTEATSDASILNSLVSQKKKYETYFEGLNPGVVDNQAVYGYNSVLKTLLDVRKETVGFKVEVFGNYFRDLVEFLRANDPEAAEAVSRNFDEFTGYIRKKYVS
jgi:transposase-like protein